MIGSSRRIHAYAYCKPADLRAGFDRLYALVHQHMQRDPTNGDAYIFINRTRKRAKVLYWDGTGLCILAKRLEQGLFSAPWEMDSTGPIRMTMSELALLLEGSTAIGKIKLSPPQYV